jgi:uncharacterized repeat protein (TIGR03803 family)
MGVMRIHRAASAANLLVGGAMALAAFTAPLAARSPAAPPVNAKQYSFTVLHTFEGSPDGTNPSPLIQDSSGTMYGTAEAGGNDNDNCEFGCGMVYKVDTSGNLTVLYDFAGGSNGGYPVAALAEDSSGNLYGTTQGLGDTNRSVVFKLAPDGTETSFVPPGSVAGGALNSPVALDAKGNLYGEDPYGGTPDCGWDDQDLGCGTLFKMTPKGKFSLVHTFTGTDGMNPQSGLVQDAKGNFYGAAFFGGIKSCKSSGNGHEEPGCGTIFKVDVHGKYTVLHTFTGKKDGSGPLGVIIDPDGNLYGIAENGGDYQGNGQLYGLGTIFRLDTRTGVFKVLFTFTPDITESSFFANLLVRDSDGNLYGAQQLDCANNAGCLFRIDTKGNYTDLFDFAAANGDQDPGGFFPNGLVLGSAGKFYGSMELGGNGFPGGFGTLFKISP